MKIQQLAGAERSTEADKSPTTFKFTIQVATPKRVTIDFILLGGSCSQLQGSGEMVKTSEA